MASVLVTLERRVYLQLKVTHAAPLGTKWQTSQIWKSQNDLYYALNVNRGETYFIHIEPPAALPPTNIYAILQFIILIQRTNNIVNYD